VKTLCCVRKVRDVKVFALLLATVTVPAVSAEQPPKANCPFDGFDPTARIAEVTTSTTGYYGCGSSKNCLSAHLVPGDTVVVFRNESDWICGYFSSSNGSAPGWVITKDTRLVDFDPNPPLEAWVGTWTQREDRIRISLSKAQGKLALEGNGIWHGIKDVQHTGEFAGEATPNGNRLHFVQGDSDSCTIDLGLSGNYLIANDNQRCGGMNVRFWGVWRRSKQ